MLFMKRQYCTAIQPILDDGFRPVWSVMIPTYNCAKYLRETLTSVLAQDIGSDLMQIEVVDDASSDNPAAIVNAIGQGRVSFYRQPKNVGHIENFQTCLARSRGKLVHLLHGDDAIRDGFYRTMQQAFEVNSQVGAAFCRHEYINEQSQPHYLSEQEQSESGVLNNWLEKLATRQRIQTPSIVVRRDVYEALGGFDRRLTCVEDWEMWVRIATHYPVWYEVEPLALYRTHSSSNTGRHQRSGENVRYMRRAIEIMKEYLPRDRADQITNTALEYYAFYALRQAEKLTAQGQTYAALNHIREGLRCYMSPRTIRRALKLSPDLVRQSLTANFRLI